MERWRRDGDQPGGDHRGSGRPEQAARLAVTLGSVSNGRDGIYAAQAIAAVIAVAMAAPRPEAMRTPALAAVPADSWTSHGLQRAAAICARLSDDLDTALGPAELTSWWFPGGPGPTW